MSSQTALMEAQTARLQEQTEAAALQNEIIALNLVNELRDQILASVETRPLGEWLATIGVLRPDDPLVRYGSSSESCALGFDMNHPLSGPTSDAAIGAIVQLAQSDRLGARVIEALGLLAGDRHGSVALAAATALEAVGQPVSKGIVLRDLFLPDTVRLTAQVYDVNLRRSYVMNFVCPNCRVHLTGSMYQFGAPIEVSGGYNLAINPRADDAVNGVLVAARGELGATWLPRPATALEVGSFFPATFSAWVTRHKDLPACDVLAELAQVNPLLRMMSVPE
ncbi:MAG: hypothetical protein AAF601_03260 [Pseudomonadota bacterium]